MKRIALVAAIAVISLPAGTARGGEGSADDLYGIVGNRVLYQQLVRVDPQTLTPAAHGVALAGHRAAWSFSPDRRQLVLGRSRESCGSTSLRFVDAAQMQVLGDVTIAESGPVRATAWLGAGTVAAVVGPSPCGAATQTRIVTVDARSPQVSSRTWLEGTALSFARVPGRLVVLLGPRSKVGTATLAVVGADGAVRRQRLEAFAAGQDLPAGRPGARVSRPGLAVDPVGGRAFVVPEGDRIAEVDLRTLRVEYRELAERALAKSIDPGHWRAALWLGGGLLAVTGSDVVGPATDGQTQVRPTPAGLRIVDTRDWTFRTLDPQVSSVQLAGTMLLARGAPAAGLIAYGRGGHARYRVFDGLPVGWVAVLGGRGYAAVGGNDYRNRTVEFDLATGALGRTLAQPLWELLLGRAADG